MSKSGKGKALNLLLLILFAGFLLYSHFADYQQGMSVGLAFRDVLVDMMKILPFAFILIGLLEVWVSEKKIIQHLGKGSGWKAYVWVLLLAGVSIGGLFVGLPLAQSLRKKGASLRVIFVYLGFVGVGRIPMTLFEISFLGLPFTAVRLMTAIPFFLLSGIILGNYLTRKGFTFSKGIGNQKS